MGSPWGDGTGITIWCAKINGFTEGNYVLVKFSLNAGGVAELNTSLNMSEDIIRFLVSRI